MELKMNLSTYNFSSLVLVKDLILLFKKSIV